MMTDPAADFVETASDEGPLVTGLEEPVAPRSRANPTKMDPDEFFSTQVFRIVYQTNNFLLPQIREMLSQRNILNIRPEYQRRLRWSTLQKSRLIESLLLNIPIPPVFFYETSDARYEVMDGQQRLNAISEYLDGDFALSGLEVLSPLNGVRYTKAPPRMKRALDRASVSAIVLLLESDSERLSHQQFSIIDIRRFVFDRLNTGGTKLNAQELRNAIYPGPFNEAIIKLARDDTFTSIFGIPPYTKTDPNDYYENPRRQKNTLYRTMGDCQLVLRYFALRDASNIRGSMQAMLDRAMESRIDSTEADASRLTEEYIGRLRIASEIFGPKAFLLPPDESGRRRISAALYDATLVALHRQWSHREDFVASAGLIRERLEADLRNQDTAAILTAQSNTANAVRDRIAVLEKVLAGGG